MKLFDKYYGIFALIAISLLLTISEANEGMLYLQYQDEAIKCEKQNKYLSMDKLPEIECEDFNNTLNMNLKEFF